MKRRKNRLPFVRRFYLWRARRGNARGFVVPRRYVAVAMILLVLAAVGYSYYRFDRAIIPLVLEAADLRLQAEVNNVINAVIQEIITERRITAADFYTQHANASGGAPVLSVNTVLVNALCNEAAQRISARLNTIPPETVSIPMGMAFSLDTLSQVGPHFRFNMAPIGNALVNYDSMFTAVGIN